MPDPLQRPPLTVLRSLDHLYSGDAIRGAGSEELPGPLSLKALGAELGVQVGSPPTEATVLVVGDPGCGKSAFVNALAQELVLGSGGSKPARRTQQSLQWVRSEAAPSGSVPRLLAEVGQQFPTWLKRGSDCQDLSAFCAGTSASPRLDGVDFVEATPHLDSGDAEPIAWLAGRAAVIVCLLDSQRQPAVSNELLQWLASVASGEKANLQFVLSKADLITRESDRIRLVAKASKLLTERFGQSFEILPVATGDLSSLLDGLDIGQDDTPPSITVFGRDIPLPATAAPAKDAPEGSASKRRFDAGPLRVVKAAEAVASQRTDVGLATLKTDCEALVAALATALAAAAAAARAQTGSGSLRVKFLQCAGALAIVAGVVPFFLEEDVETWVVHACVGAAGGLAALFIMIAACMPGAPRVEVASVPSGIAEKRVGALAERGQLLRLVERQRARWAGEQPASWAASSESAGTEFPAAGNARSDATRRGASANKTRDAQGSFI